MSVSTVFGWRAIRYSLVAFFIAAHLCSGTSRSEQSDRLSIALEALRRLKGVDLEANPTLKAAVLKVVDATRGTPQYVELVREFNIKGQSSALLDFATQHPVDAAGVEAIRIV